MKDLFGAIRKFRGVREAGPEDVLLIDRPGSYVLNGPVAGVTITVGGVDLDLQGHTLTGNGGMGIKVTGDGEVSISNGQLSGFSYGIHSLAPQVSVRSVIADACKCIGFHLAGDKSSLTYSRVIRVGGDPEQAYAIGANVCGRNSTVEYCEFLDIYRQNAPETIAGEGCAVVVNASAVECVVRRNRIVNDEPKPRTIGIFAGIGGSHSVDDNTIIGADNGLMTHAPISIRRNVIWLPQHISNSVALRGPVAPDGNLISGYDQEWSPEVF